MRKKVLHKKKNTTARQKNTFSILFLVALLLAALALLSFANIISVFNTPKNPVNKQASADFGGVENILNQTGEWDKNIKFGYYNNRIVLLPSSPLAYTTLDQRVLSAVTNDEKWIEVNLTDQKLRAYEGNKLIYEFLVSSGMPWTPTVTGDFRIWYKTRWTRMSGGSKEAGNFYDLPNVPFNMFFHGDYALHGAYWHNNFGHPMSHGCVNIGIPDAEKLFYWTSPVVPDGQGATRASEKNPGTRVVVRS